MKLTRTYFDHSAYSVLCIELNSIYFEHLTHYNPKIKHVHRVLCKYGVLKNFDTRKELFAFMRTNPDHLEQINQKEKS